MSDPSMMTPGMASLPMDLQMDYQTMQRRRAIQQAMMQQAMQVPQAPQIKGRFQGQVSPLAAITGPLAAFAAEKGMQNSDKEMTGLGQRYQNAQADAVTKYMQTRQGTPGTPEVMPVTTPPVTAVDDEGQPNPETTWQPGKPATPGVAADPRGAIVQGLTSGFPGLHEAAKADLTQLNKAALLPKDLLLARNLDPQKSVIAAQLLAAGVPEVQVYSLLEGKKEYTNAGGGNLVQTQGAGTEAGPKPSGYFGPTFADPSMIKGPNGPVLTQKNNQSGKQEGLDKAAHVSNSLNMPDKITVNADDKGLTAATHIYEKHAEAATIAVQDMNLIRQMKSLNDKVPEGVTGAGEIWVRNLASRLGLKQDEIKNVSGQVFNNLLQNSITNRIVGPGGARISDSDARRLEQALPNATNSTAARAVILDIMHQYSQQKYDTYQETRKQLQKGYPQAPVFGVDIVPRINVEPSAVGSPPGPNTSTRSSLKPNANGGYDYVPGSR